MQRGDINIFKDLKKKRIKYFMVKHEFFHSNLVQDKTFIQMKNMKPDSIEC